MDNVIIKEVEVHKHLGLTISEDGNWNEHVKNIMIKVSSRSSVSRRIKFKPKRSLSSANNLTYHLSDHLWNMVI